MPTLSEKSIRSFKQFVGFIEDLRSNLHGPLWYRGCAKSSYELKPSLYRHKKTKTIESFIELEKKLISLFQQRSIPFHARTLSDGWELLFFMQHYGVPTRLLDWTESPLLALFFAVTSSLRHLNAAGKPIFESDAAVWILDPIRWNKHAVNLRTFEGKVLAVDDSHLNAYGPSVDCNIMKDFPIAIYGAHNSYRIVAQRGVFVVFGKQTHPMEVIFQDHNFPGNALKKLVIPKEKLPHFYDAVRHHGITDSVVFPDLDGLAREIRREFKFEV